MNQEALIKLAELLETKVREDEFNLIGWTGFTAKKRMADFNDEGDKIGYTLIEVDDATLDYLLFGTYDTEENEAVIENAERFSADLAANYLQPTPVEIPHNCGAHACACGHAGLDGWFRERGFTTNIKGHVQWRNPAAPDRGNNPDADDFIYEGWDGVDKFFDLNHDEAHFLFSSESFAEEDIKKPLAVAKRIREFVAGTSDYEAPDYGHIY